MLNWERRGDFNEAFFRFFGDYFFAEQTIVPTCSPWTAFLKLSGSRKLKTIIGMSCSAHFANAG